MSQAVKSLLEILDLETLEVNLFRGLSPKSGWQRVFGGQVIGAGAGRRHPHGGGAGRYIRCTAISCCRAIRRCRSFTKSTALRDGRSFTTRGVRAIQHGRAIFSMLVSFHRDEPGFSHQAEMPKVPGPEELPSDEEIRKQILPNMPEQVRAYYERERPIELRPVEFGRYTSRDHRDPKFHVWIRSTAPLPPDPAIHQCVLAYASDMTLLDTSLIPHGRTVFDTSIQAASLDHALWFHRPFRADEWLLYAQDTPNASGARGLSRGLIFSRDGTLVASVAQEGLIREAREALAKK